MGLELQDFVKRFYDSRGYEASAQTLMLGIMEEVGELAQAILLTECDDFKSSRHKQQLEVNGVPMRDVGHEVGDVIIYLMALCNRLGIKPYLKPITAEVRLEVIVDTIRGEENHGQGDQTTD